MKNSYKADIVLLIVTVIWGAGFPVTKFALQTITPMYIIAFRFIIASLVLSIVFYKKLKYLNKEIIKPSLFLAFLLFMTYVFQTIGMQYTTASKAGFFIGMAVIIVPFFSYFYLKTKIKTRIILSTVIAAIGLFLLSFEGSALSFNKGDILMILSAICAAWHLVFSSAYVVKHDAILLSLLHMVFVALFGSITAIIVEPFPTNISVISFGSLLFMGILCTAFGFLVQIVALNYTTATHEAIIFTMEPVFGAITSWILLNEQLGVKGIVGGVLIVFAMLLSELNIKFFTTS
ncbi:MAG: DMT family transporter [Firmicutes bacterium]|nr:DMT family transporter [Bacillota bacterium]